MPTFSDDLKSLDGGNSFADDLASLDAPKGGGFIASAKQIGGQSIKGIGRIASDYLGAGDDNALTRYGQSVIDANPTAVRGLSDIADSPWMATKEATGNAAGSMAGMVAARALGQGITAAAPLTGPLAPLTAAIGQGVSWGGPALMAALPSYSGIRDTQIHDDPAMRASAAAKLSALAGAGTVGAIETRYGPQAWALKAMSKEGRAQLAKQFTGKTLAGKIGKGAAKGAAIEGTEELVQNPVEQVAAFQNPTTRENIEETLFGGAMGAIGGGVLGGGFGALAPRMGGTEPEPRPEPRPEPEPETMALPNPVIVPPGQYAGNEDAVRAAQARADAVYAARDAYESAREKARQGAQGGFTADEVSAFMAEQAASQERMKAALAEKNQAAIKREFAIQREHARMEALLRRDQAIADGMAEVHFGNEVMPVAESLDVQPVEDLSGTVGVEYFDDEEIDIRPTLAMRQEAARNAFLSNEQPASYLAWANDMDMLGFVSGMPLEAQRQINNTVNVLANPDFDVRVKEMAARRLWQLGRKHQAGPLSRATSQVNRFGFHVPFTASIQPPGDTMNLGEVANFMQGGRGATIQTPEISPQGDQGRRVELPGSGQGVQDATAGGMAGGSRGAGRIASGAGAALALGGTGATRQDVTPLEGRTLAAQSTQPAQEAGQKTGQEVAPSGWETRYATEADARRAIKRNKLKDVQVVLDGDGYRLAAATRKPKAASNNLIGRAPMQRESEETNAAYQRYQAQAEEDAGTDQAGEPREGAQARGAESRATQAQEPGEAGFGLNGQTEAKAQAEAARIAQIAKDEAEAKQRDEREAKRQREDAETASRQRASAENFVLGQRAEDALAWQGDILAQPAKQTQKPEPKPAEKSQPVTLSFADIPPMMRDAIRVTIPVVNTRTKAYENREVSATDAMNATDSDIKQMRALLACMRA